MRAWDPSVMVFTSNTMSHYEFTRVLAVRTKDISLHGSTYTDCTDIVDAKQRALKELRDRRCPLIIERTTAMQDNVKVIEAFRVRDMNIPFLEEEPRPVL
jgi:DNA-directed RNA polymerase subunit K/omega